MSAGKEDEEEERKKEEDERRTWRSDLSTSGTSGTCVWTAVNVPVARADISL